MHISTFAATNYKKSILVVDDYLPTRSLMVEALDLSGDYEISEAGDGTEALQLIKSRPYDMVISDIMMPVMGGMELLETIREMKSSTAVIMVTAHPALELTVTAMKQGAVDFLKKPFNIDELLFKVNLYLHDSETSRDGEEKNESRYLQTKKEQLSLQSYIYDEIENAAGDQEEIFQQVVELALQIVEGESCALFLYDEKSKDFYLQVSRSSNGSSQQNAIPFVAGIFKDVVAKKSALMINSDSDPLIAPSLICVPLMIRDNV
jgi:DNA-binding response OmpR family regulator